MDIRNNAHASLKLALVFFLGCICSLFLSHVIKPKLLGRLDSGLLLVQGVDFSVPGEYVVKFDDYDPCMYLKLVMQLPNSMCSNKSIEALFDGFEGRFLIRDEANDNPYAGSLEPGYFESRFGPVASFYHSHLESSKGRNEIKVTILKGAPNLTNVPQRLVLYGWREGPDTAYYMISECIRLYLSRGFLIVSMLILCSVGISFIRGAKRGQP
jgi:hypothetical protein